MEHRVVDFRRGADAHAAWDWLDGGDLVPGAEGRGIKAQEEFTAVGHEAEAGEVDGGVVGGGIEAQGADGAPGHL